MPWRHPLESRRGPLDRLACTAAYPPRWGVPGQRRSGLRAQHQSRRDAFERGRSGLTVRLAPPSGTGGDPIGPGRASAAAANRRRASPSDTAVGSPCRSDGRPRVASSKLALLTPAAPAGGPQRERRGTWWMSQSARRSARCAGGGAASAGGVSGLDRSSTSRSRRSSSPGTGVSSPWSPRRSRSRARASSRARPRSPTVPCHRTQLNVRRALPRSGDHAFGRGVAVEDHDRWNPS